MRVVGLCVFVCRGMCVAGEEWVVYLVLGLDVELDFFAG